MCKYDPKSGKAEEFINDQEIRDTLAYADANKDNKDLILSIIEKARDLKGLSIVKPLFYWPAKIRNY